MFKDVRPMQRLEDEVFSKFMEFFTAAYGNCFPIKRGGRKEAVFRKIRKSWLKKSLLKFI